MIGGGISGALLANQLVKKGVDCILVDRRDIGHGSTSASTALLQYEIDTPLYKLRKQVGNHAAELAYSMGIESIYRLHKLAQKDCAFKLRPSLQIAKRGFDVAGLRREYEARRDLNFPVALLNRADLKKRGIEAAGALRSAIAAEVDPYRLTHRLLRLACARGLRVFDRTAIMRYENSSNHVTAITDRGSKVTCKAVFFATGYETRDILPKDLIQFKSTYAFVSEPLADLKWWNERAVIWGTGDPYLYMRTTSDNRIIVGGEDDRVLNPQRRDKQIERKTVRLITASTLWFRIFASKPHSPGWGYSAALRMVLVTLAATLVFRVPILLWGRRERDYFQ